MSGPSSRTVSPNTGAKGSTSPVSSKKQRESDEHVSDEEEQSAQEDGNDSGDRPQAPMQKRRRVTRACDECRRKKIKCDGKQPCTHCTVYSYECTYDQPSNRRRNPAPQYIEALEQRLQKAEGILRSVLPGIDLDDPKYDVHGIDQIVDSVKGARSRQSQLPSKHEDDAHMRSMVDRTGSLDLDDTGNWDYHGHSSGYSFLRKFRAQFGETFLPRPQLTVDHKALARSVDSPKSLLSSPFDPSVSPSPDLPPREVALELCRNAIDDCCALQRPLHRPTFIKRLHAVYDTDPENYTNDHIRFLPLLYVVMALGCLFARTEHEKNNELDQKGYKYAVEQGYQYFNIGKSMMDITDCRDLVSIQAVMFMILFLQGTAKLATCYAYIGVALRACCRLGMHRKLTANFNAIEQEERKRIFWNVRKMDIYVGAMLGLPQMLSSDDIDQEPPSEVDDKYITETGIIPAPRDNFALIKASNAHGRLMRILQKVVRYVYPIKPANGGIQGDHYTIQHSLIRELERDLQQWMDELPLQLRPSDNTDIELSRVQQLLRMSYAYVQMMIYRPFLHYVSQACQTGKTDKRSFACAAACVSVARNIVHITTEMRRRGLLVGAYWFVMYTTYFAILSLVYFVLENPESTTSKDILKDAMEGRDTLASLAKRSMAADRCTSSLSGLFDELPEKLKQRRTSLQTAPNISRKRPSPNSESGLAGAQSKSPTAATFAPGVRESGSFTPHRARTIPSDYLAKMAKRNSMPDPNSATASPFPYKAETAFTGGHSPSMNNTMGFPTPQSATSNMAAVDFGTPALVQGHLPDLKNVMFPGDNPFAYPNQPISTLEESQFGGIQDPAFGPDSFNSGPYGTPTSLPSQRQGEFDNRMHSIGEDISRFGGQQHYGQQQHSGRAHSLFDMPDVSNLVAEPASLHPMGSQQGNLQVSGQGQEEDYWSDAPAKGQFRTGLTPGGPGVNLNLDDLFGNSQSWGMGGMAGGADPMSGISNWPGQSNPNW